MIWRYHMSCVATTTVVKITPQKGNGTLEVKTVKPKSKEGTAVEMSNHFLSTKNKLNIEVVEKAVQALITSTREDHDSNLIDGPKMIGMYLAAIKKPHYNECKELLWFQLKHCPYSQPDVCLFVNDLFKDQPERTVNVYQSILKKHGITGISKILTRQEFISEYKEVELQRKLVNAFDIFLAEPVLKDLLFRNMKKEFYSKNKLPRFAKISDDMQQIKDKVMSALHRVQIKVFNQQECFSIPVGCDDISVKAIAENILVVANVLDQKFPGGWNNIREISIRCSGKLLPIYLSTVDPNTVPVPILKTRLPKMADSVTGELSTIGKNVEVAPDGTVKVLKTKKGKKAKAKETNVKTEVLEVKPVKEEGSEEEEDSDEFEGDLSEVEFESEEESDNDEEEEEKQTKILPFKGTLAAVKNEVKSEEEDEDSEEENDEGSDDEGETQAETEYLKSFKDLEEDNDDDDEEEEDDDEDEEDDDEDNNEDDDEEDSEGADETEHSEAAFSFQKVFDNKGGKKRSTESFDSPQKKGRFSNNSDQSGEGEDDQSDTEGVGMFDTSLGQSFGGQRGRGGGGRGRGHQGWRGGQEGRGRGGYRGGYGAGRGRGGYRGGYGEGRGRGGFRGGYGEGRGRGGFRGGYGEGRGRGGFRGGQRRGEGGGGYRGGNRGSSRGGRGQQNGSGGFNKRGGGGSGFRGGKNNMNKSERKSFMKQNSK